MPRTRTTKKLAQRIDLDYFKRTSPLRRWRFLLSVAALVLAIFCVAWFALRSDRRVYSAGNLSSAHAVLTTQCSVCHVSTLGFYDKKVIDQKCSSCHDGSVHHANQAFTPTCAACHADHRGAIKLAATSDANCAQCHANLETRGSSAGFVKNISSFEGNHPEFAAVRAERRDPGTIQLNHSIHMQPNLLGPNGARVQMLCSDCHRAAADSANAWPYGDAKSQAVEASKNLSGADSNNESNIAIASRAYMAPATYAQTCAGCHSLQFDKRIADGAPHDKPEVIHPVIVAKLQAYIAGHPEELRVPRDPIRDLPEKMISADYRMLTPSQWIAERVAEDEQLLWRKTCKQCHALSSEPSAALPKIAPSNITALYMPHAKFDHSQHGLVNCTGCHAAALTSQQNSDVLLPGIATCRTCHHAGTEAAESRCFECHTYHDPTQRKSAHSNFSAAELDGSALNK